MHAQDHAATQTWAIAVDHVSKTYRQRLRPAGAGGALKRVFKPVVRDLKALDDVSLAVAPGEIVAYAGPNGAGKSTTVKILSGLLAPDTGTVRVLGMDPIRERVRYVGRIGVVFGQRMELWWDHPVVASYEWKRSVWDIPRDAYERNTRWVRDFLGLDDIWEQSARELSLGQKMRAELGLALIHDPEILFLDEPTIGMDVLGKRRMLDAVRELNRERGITVVVTSHDMDDLEQLASRIVMIDHGRIAFDGGWGDLRGLVSSHRRIVLTAPEVPRLDGARHIRSEDGRHTFEYDPSVTPVASLLEQARGVTDVETLTASIDEIVASLYEDWSRR